MSQLLNDLSRAGRSNSEDAFPSRKAKTASSAVRKKLYPEPREVNLTRPSVCPKFSSNERGSFAKEARAAARPRARRSRRSRARRLGFHGRLRRLRIHIRAETEYENGKEKNSSHGWASMRLSPLRLCDLSYRGARVLLRPGSQWKEIETLRKPHEATPALPIRICVENPVQPTWAGLLSFSTRLPERGMDTGSGHTPLAGLIYHTGESEIKTQYPRAKSDGTSLIRLH